MRTAMPSITSGHPLAIMARLLMEHVMRPAQSRGFNGDARTGEWQGCPDLHCRPFYQDYEVDGAGRLLCSSCGDAHQGDRAMREHLVRVHGVRLQSVVRPTGPVKCDCGVTLANRNSYIKHINRGRCSVYHPHKTTRWKRRGEVKARR
jgi:uncharacterized C2H2 Zn-finger protein